MKISSVHAIRSFTVLVTLMVVLVVPAPSSAEYPGTWVGERSKPNYLFPEGEGNKFFSLQFGERRVTGDDFSGSTYYS